MESAEASQPDPLALTPRQRRLRVLTVVILAAVILMIIVGLTHPFFRPTRPPVLTDQVRRALQAKVLIVGFYWIFCALLATSLFILAWLDLREVRRKLLLARRDMWKDILEQHRERRADRSSAGNDQ